MTKKKSEKQVKFWVVDNAGDGVGYGDNYSSFKDAQNNAEGDDIIHECVVTKSFALKGWVEEK